MKNGRCRFCDRSKTQKPYGALGWGLLQQAPPNALALLLLVIVHPPVMSQDVHHDGFGHHGVARWGAGAQDWQGCGYSGVLEQILHPGVHRSQEKIGRESCREEVCKEG